MGDQNKKIDRADPTMAWKSRVAVKIVVGNVAHQEQCRKDCGRQHKAHLPDPVPSANVDIAEDQANSAPCVETRISRGQSGCPAWTGNSALEVDEPNQKPGN